MIVATLAAIETKAAARTYSDRTRRDTCINCDASSTNQLYGAVAAHTQGWHLSGWDSMAQCSRWCYPRTCAMIGAYVCTTRECVP